MPTQLKKVIFSANKLFLLRCQAVLIGRFTDLVGYLIAFLVTILVLLLNVTVITDGRVRKFVMSSSVSLAVSFLKELISVMQECKFKVFVIIILDQYSGISKHFSGCYFLFQMPTLAFCDKWCCWLNVFVALVTGHVFCYRFYSNDFSSCSWS